MYFRLITYLILIFGSLASYCAAKDVLDLTDLLKNIVTIVLPSDTSVAPTDEYMKTKIDAVVPVVALVDFTTTAAKLPP